MSYELMRHSSLTVLKPTKSEGWAAGISRCCWLLAQRFCESPKQRQQKALFKTGSRILQDRCSVRTVTCAWAVWQRLSCTSRVSWRRACGSTSLIPLRLSPPPQMIVSHGQALISCAVAQLCSLLVELGGRQLFGRQHGDTLT